ncbi:pentapeptide repeat-containing protein [Actinoplanes sp. NPDC049548]|uniref:pentapeptide repeat-containing protein n=1 Tax=Actinoplanes sp. NPDC049548 TaxID=3155152 RepID=UPI003429A121
MITNNYNRDQQALALQGQITDRFTRAVEQLGQPGPQKIDVRMGAIYALQRIMRDSEDDQAAVVDILCAFIRVHSQVSDEPESRFPAAPPADIQAAMTVLARRVPGRGDESRLVLSFSNFGRAVLPAGKFAGADLVGADLRDADLHDADLSGANLDAAYLHGTDLSGAVLIDVQMKSNANGVNLNGADLRGAHLSADLIEADLSGANLIGADLSGANLKGADLQCVKTDQTTSLPLGTELPNCP